MNKPLWLADLEQVSKKLNFSIDGGFIEWVTDHFRVLGVDGATLARIKSGVATEDDDVVVLSQLKATQGNVADYVDKLLAAIPIIITGVVADVASLTDAVTNDGKNYIVDDGAAMAFYRSGSGEWTEFTPSEQQLITFVTNKTLSANYILQEDTTTIANVYDSHIYSFESSTVLKDNGADSGLETKLALLKTELETLITESIAESLECTVKSQEIAFDKNGLSNASFAVEIPSGAKIVKTRTIIETEGDVPKVNVSYSDAGVVFSETTARFNTKGISVVEERHIVTGIITLSASFASVPTVGSGVLEITYSLPVV